MFIRRTYDLLFDNNSEHDHKSHARENNSNVMLTIKEGEKRPIEQLEKERYDDEMTIRLADGALTAVMGPSISIKRGIKYIDSYVRGAHIEPDMSCNSSSELTMVEKSLASNPEDLVLLKKLESGDPVPRSEIIRSLRQLHIVVECSESSYKLRLGDGLFKPPLTYMTNNSIGSNPPIFVRFIQANKKIKFLLKSHLHFIKHEGGSSSVVSTTVEKSLDKSLVKKFDDCTIVREADHLTGIDNELVYSSEDSMVPFKNRQLEDAACKSLNLSTREHKVGMRSMVSHKINFELTLEQLFEEVEDEEKGVEFLKQFVKEDCNPQLKLVSHVGRGLVFCRYLNIKPHQRDFKRIPSEEEMDKSFDKFVKDDQLL